MLCNRRPHLHSPKRTTHEVDHCYSHCQRGETESDLRPRREITAEPELELRALSSNQDSWGYFFNATDPKSARRSQCSAPPLDRILTPPVEMASQITCSWLTWGKICLPVETNDALLLACHQDVIPNLNLQSFTVQAADR